MGAVLSLAISGSIAIFLCDASSSDALVTLNLRTSVAAMEGLRAILWLKVSATALIVTSSCVGPTPPEVITMSYCWD